MQEKNMGHICPIGRSRVNIKSFSELLRSYIHSFMNRLQCSNNLILSAICESTVPMYSNIWTWWYDMLIL